MYILHGTWIPRETDDFVQTGRFYLWVETAAILKIKPGYRVDPLPPKELDELLVQELGFASNSYVKSVRHQLGTFYQFLPSTEGKLLPSPELARWLTIPSPEEPVTLSSYEITGYPLKHILRTLNDLHFQVCYQHTDMQLGQDLLFWMHYSQVLRQLLRKDHYIPALQYRELPGKRKTASAFEIRPTWEIISESYETQLQQAVRQMPLACLGATETLQPQPAFYDRQELLRHFSECVLTEAVTSPSPPAVFEKKIRDSLLYHCLHPESAKSFWSTPAALERYRQWQHWRQAVAAKYSDGFQLCFQLLEGTDENSPWQLRFLATSRQDPSLRLNLDEYWHLNARAKKELLKSFGEDFEQQLMRNLGYAARIYPKLWQGLETDRLTGLELSLEEAFAFLIEQAWVLEDAGFKIIVPAWWTPEGRRKARLRVTVSKRKAAPAAGKSYLSLESLVQYRYALAIGDQTVTEQEWQQLVNAKAPLVKFRGQWVELDRDKMQQLLEFWQTHGQEDAHMSVGELLRKAAEDEDEVDVSQDSLLAEMLIKLHDPGHFEPIADPPELHGTLREYQKRGVAWLQFLESLGLNGCLADDMGLGKTVQVITRLLLTRDSAQSPTLLIAPTSVLGNWQKEIEKFAPQLQALLHHGSNRLQDIKAFKAACEGQDIVITSYTLARKDINLLQSIPWERVVVDEAQNIKNPKTAQTKAILKLKASHRLAMTGTPVENRVLDLWSIFNFLNPGYLGNQTQFRQRFELPIQKNNDLNRSVLLKRLVQPFILRRIKTDKAIIKDLPDKLEQKQYCNLTREQASLYQAVVDQVGETLEEAEGIQRKGLILSTLMKLKQVCNHPRQFLQDNSAFTLERSHKLERLSEMVEEVFAEGESLLIFTQFTDIGEALYKHLTQTLNHRSYYLHGGTPRARREHMISEFQDPDTEPAAFILSLKAGGVGINLTKANHVFHFDRWWNPAVEDQATDRAFRIGQSRTVLVHKFVTLGTLEERIDQMIEDKKQMAGAIIGADESWLTELDNASFQRLIALNRSAVLD
jgi:SNF2 family DNA or RNA helicase